MARNDDTGAPRTTAPRRAVRLEPGSRVDDYELEAPLATGGFGTVYRARHITLGRVAAIKVLHPELVSSGEALTRFEREARTVNLFRHPNVVDVFDFGTLADGRPYFVMELIEGIDLDTLIAQRGAQSPSAVLELMTPLCDAVSVAHEHGVVHRDIKASNVMLAGERVVLLDFGVVKLLDANPADQSTVRRMVGSPACMAPEQINGGPVDVRTDIYALGVLTFHLLSGEPPYPTAQVEVAQYKHLTATRPRVSTRASLSHHFDEVITRAMAISPADRHQTVAEFVAALAAATVAHEEEERRITPSTQRCLGLHLRIDLTSTPEGIDYRALRDLDRIAPAATRFLIERGFVIAIEGPSSMLAVRPLGDVTDQDRREAILDALALADQLAKRPEADPRLRLGISLELGDAVMAGDRVIGGALTHVSTWVPTTMPDGVVGPSAVFDGLDVITERVADTQLLRAFAPLA